MFELLEIVERFAVGFFELPELIVGRRDYRILIASGLLVRGFAVVGQLVHDGAIELISLELDVDPLELDVVLPMSRPALAAFALITAVTKWNDYLWPRIVTSKLSSTTLPVGLTLLRDSEGVNEWGPILAGAVLIVLPVIPAGEPTRRLVHRQPAMNLVAARVVPIIDANGRSVRSVSVGTMQRTFGLRDGESVGAHAEVVLGIRPEHFDPAVRPAGGGGLDGVVRVVEPLGSDLFVTVEIGEGTRATARLRPEAAVRIGDRIGLTISLAGAHLFAPVDGGRLASCSAEEP